LPDVRKFAKLVVATIQARVPCREGSRCPFVGNACGLKALGCGVRNPTCVYCGVVDPVKLGRG